MIFTPPFLGSLSHQGLAPSFLSVHTSGGVNDLAVVGNTLYVVGNFGTVTDANGSYARNRIASLNLANALWTAWDPNADASVNRILCSAGRIFVGGSFSNIGGAARSRLAELDPFTALATSWDPNAGSIAQTLFHDVANGVIYVGGTFSNFNGVSRDCAACVDDTTAALKAWQTPTTVATTIESIIVIGNQVYFGGTFTDGVNLRVHGANCAAFPTIPGPMGNWNPNVTGNVLTNLYYDGTSVFVFGKFTALGTGPTSRSNAGSTAPTGSTVLSYNPNPNGDKIYSVSPDGLGNIYITGDTTVVGGVTTSVAKTDKLSGAVDSGFVSVLTGGTINGAYRILSIPGVVVVGGDFTTVNGTGGHTNLAFLNPSTGNLF